MERSVGVCHVETLSDTLGVVVRHFVTQESRDTSRPIPCLGKARARFGCRVATETTRPTLNPGRTSRSRHRRPGASPQGRAPGCVVVPVGAPRPSSCVTPSAPLRPARQSLAPPVDEFLATHFPRIVRPETRAAVKRKSSRRRHRCQSSRPLPVARRTSCRPGEVRRRARRGRSRRSFSETSGRFRWWRTALSMTAGCLAKPPFPPQCAVARNPHQPSVVPVVPTTPSPAGFGRTLTT